MLLTEVIRVANNLQYKKAGLMDCSPVMNLVSFLSKTKKFESLMPDFIEASEEVLGCTTTKSSSTVAISL